jgi:hypothetical protein
MTRSYPILYALGLSAVAVLPPRWAAAQSAVPPAPHADAAFDFMNLLNQHGLHDLASESWNAYGQINMMTVYQFPWRAPYTNTNGSNSSAYTDAQGSFAYTFTLYLGVRLWPGGEAYVAPEGIGEKALSDLKGFGGVTEIFELQKVGGETPSVYRGRLFLRQTIALGGDPVVQDSNPLQLGNTTRSHRFVLTFGNFSALDVFDKNNVTSDPRQTFFNEAFMTHSSYDFPADARGYTFGLAAELYWGDWAIRLGHLLPPVEPNQQSIDFHFWLRYGDSLEVEHDHVIHGLSGAVRLLAYRNQVLSGRFADAVALFDSGPDRYNAGNCPSNVYNYGSGNFNAPDLCWVRKTNQKLGIGLNAEQFIADGIGLFLRAMYSDGQSEVDAYDSADSDLSFGAVAKGNLWRRPFDVAGIGVALSWVSPIHARYLAMGGVDGFIGDGALSGPATEGLFEMFYSANLFKAIWVSADYQTIWNPGYNAARPGPIPLIGARIHAEF